MSLSPLDDYSAEVPQTPVNECVRPVKLVYKTRQQATVGPQGVAHQPPPPRGGSVASECWRQDVSPLGTPCEPVCLASVSSFSSIEDTLENRRDVYLHSYQTFQWIWCVYVQVMDTKSWNVPLVSGTGTFTVRAGTKHSY